MIRVGVIGAAGRMGRRSAARVAADADLELVAAIDPSHAGQRRRGHRRSRGLTLDALIEAGAEVAVDFTHPDGGTHEHPLVRRARRARRGRHHRDSTQDPDGPGARASATSNVFVAPNFALGAVLMQRFAAQAARHLPAAEIIELHHDGQGRRAVGHGDRHRAADGGGARRCRGRPSAARRSRAPAAATSTASASTRCACPGSSRTRRSSSAGRARRSRSATTRPTGRSFMPGVLMAVKAVAIAARPHGRARRRSWRRAP